MDDQLSSNQSNQLVNELLNNVFHEKQQDKTDNQSSISDEEEEAKDDKPQTESEKVEEAQNRAHKDFLKEEAKEVEKNKTKLDELVDNATELVLFKSKSSNPFDFFPDEIIIDTNKISIIHRQFFASERVHSVMIKDVSDVFVDTSLFFAKLSIVDIGFTENEVAIDFLNTESAMKARRVIQGLVVANNKGIDFAKLKTEMSVEEITDKIEQLGKARVGNEKTKST